MAPSRKRKAPLSPSQDANDNKNENGDVGSTSKDSTKLTKEERKKKLEQERARAKEWAESRRARKSIGSTTTKPGKLTNVDSSIKTKKEKKIVTKSVADPPVKADPGMVLDSTNETKSNKRIIKRPRLSLNKITSVLTTKSRRDSNVPRPEISRPSVLTETAGPNKMVSNGVSGGDGDVVKSSGTGNGLNVKKSKAQALKEAREKAAKWHSAKKAKEDSSKVSSADGTNRNNSSALVSDKKVIGGQTDVDNDLITKKSKANIHTNVSTATNTNHKDRFLSNEKTTVGAVVSSDVEMDKSDSATVDMHSAKTSNTAAIGQQTSISASVTRSTLPAPTPHNMSYGQIPVVVPMQKPCPTPQYPPYTPMANHQQLQQSTHQTLTHPKDTSGGTNNIMSPPQPLPSTGVNYPYSPDGYTAPRTTTTSTNSIPATIQFQQSHLSQQPRQTQQPQRNDYVVMHGNGGGFSPMTMATAATSAPTPPPPVPLPDHQRPSVFAMLKQTPITSSTKPNSTNYPGEKQEFRPKEEQKETICNSVVTENKEEEEDIEHEGQQNQKLSSADIIRNKWLSAVSIVIKLTKGLFLGFGFAILALISYFILISLLSGDIGDTNGNKTTVGLNEVESELAVDNYREEISKTIIPSCFLDTGLSLSDQFSDEYAEELGCTNPRPCPHLGHCIDGKLVNCYNLDYDDVSEDSNVECNAREGDVDEGREEENFCSNPDKSLSLSRGLYVPSQNQDECILSPLAIDAMVELKKVIVDLTVEQTCHFAPLSIGFFGSGTLSNDMIWKVESVNDSSEPISLFAIEGIANLLHLNVRVVEELVQALKNTDEDILVVTDAAAITNVKKVGKLPFLSTTWLALSPIFVQSKLPLPFHCWCQILMWDVFVSTTSIAWKLLQNAAFSLWKIGYTYPLPSLATAALLYIILWIRSRRKARSILRKKVTHVRDLAYDKLILDCDGGDGYAVLHLRDEIAHEMYPQPCFERTDLMSKVWPRVVSEVRADNRVIKSRKSVRGKSLEWWEWVAPTSSRKSRKKISDTSP